MKRKFAVSIWKENATFISQCLEVDVASQGESESVALENLREALELHYQLPSPVPTSRIVSIEVEINAVKN